jgi:hypothetical protein
VATTEPAPDVLHLGAVGLGVHAAGGGQGVGLGIAQEFVENGASVVLTGRRRAVLDEAVTRLGPKSSGIVADVAKMSDRSASRWTPRTPNSDSDSPQLRGSMDSLPWIVAAS